MSKQSMDTLRERLTELGLVQMNLWIRTEDRDEFEAAVAPFRERVAMIYLAQAPVRKSPAAVLTQSRQSSKKRSTTRKPPHISDRPSAWRSERRDWLMLPCRLTFATPPPMSIRNAMQADGWRYDEDDGIWIADQLKLAKAWLPELVEGWGALILGPAADWSRT